MNPFSVTLPDGTSFRVIQKISGRKRSIRLILFKIRRKQTLIAYHIRMHDTMLTQYTVYKIRRSGAWERGAEKNKGPFTQVDKIRTEEMKSAIDAYELKISPTTYQELF